MAKKKYKEWGFFGKKKKKMMMTLSYSCLVLDEKIQDKFIWIQKMIQKTYENGTLRKEFCFLFFRVFFFFSFIYRKEFCMLSRLRID